MQNFQGEEELKRYKLVSFMKSKWIEQKNAFKQEEINLYRNMKEKQSMQYKQLQSSQKASLSFRIFSLLSLSFSSLNLLPHITL